MFTTQQFTNRFALSGIALLLMAMVPSAIRAETIALRNDTPNAVVIQVTIILPREGFRRLRPVIINPRMVSPTINSSTDKHLVIYDAAVPTRVLFKDTIPAGLVNTGYSIQPEPPMRVKLMKIAYPVSSSQP